MLYVKELSRAAARSSALYSESLPEFTFPKLAAVVDAGRPIWRKERKLNGHTDRLVYKFIISMISMSKP